MNLENSIYTSAFLLLNKSVLYLIIARSSPDSKILFIMSTFSSPIVLATLVNSFGKNPSGFFSSTSCNVNPVAIFLLYSISGSKISKLLQLLGNFPKVTRATALLVHYTIVSMPLFVMLSLEII